VKSSLLTTAAIGIATWLLTILGCELATIYFFGANSVTPNASQGTTGVAQTFDTSTGQTVTVPLVSVGSTAFPNQISDGLAGC
jgi:hypothetical protein